MILTNVTVVLITYDVPFGEVVREVRNYASAEEGDILKFINNQAKRWWDCRDGDRWVKEATTNHNHVVGGLSGRVVVRPWADVLGPIGFTKVRVYDVEDKPVGFTPIKELGYDLAEWQLWGGESTYKAILDSETYTTLQERHYRREYDAKGLQRPGYLMAAEVSVTGPK